MCINKRGMIAIPRLKPRELKIQDQVRLRPTHDAKASRVLSLSLNPSWLKGVSLKWHYEYEFCLPSPCLVFVSPQRDFGTNETMFDQKTSCFMTFVIDPFKVKAGSKS